MRQASGVMFVARWLEYKATMDAASENGTRILCNGTTPRFKPSGWIMSLRLEHDALSSRKALPSLEWVRSLSEL